MSISQITGSQTPSSAGPLPQSQAAHPAKTPTATIKAMSADRIDRPAATQAAETTPHGFGVGLIGGASVEAGVVAGAGATASAGLGVFANGKSLHPGVFASAGSFAGVGAHGRHSAHSADRVGAVGAYAGAGVGAFITNAASAAQLAGAAQTYSLNVGVGPLKVSLQVSSAHGTYVGAVSVGPGIGVDASCYSTESVASTR